MSEDFLIKGISSIMVIVIAVALGIFWISMLIDCANRTFKRPKHKIFWIFFIALLQIMGAFFYWLVVRRKT